MKDLYKLLGIQEIQTTPYHPQGDGMVERFNGTLKQMLRKILPDWEGQWDKAVLYILGEYISTPNETTGFTPSELLFGRQIRGPLQALTEKWTAETSSTQNVVTYVMNAKKRET